MQGLNKVGKAFFKGEIEHKNDIEWLKVEGLNRFRFQGEGRP